jgi:hypothetical protein
MDQNGARQTEWSERFDHSYFETACEVSVDENIKDVPSIIWITKEVSQNSPLTFRSLTGEEKVPF